VPSPDHQSRHGVAVPCRVLLGDEVAGSLGYPLPVRRCRWQALRPSGIPRVALAQGSDSLSDPLLGFGPPSRYFPKSPPAVSRPQAPLLGFVAPTALGEEGIHGSPVARTSSPGVWPGIVSADPTPPTTAPLTGSLNLSATSSSLRRPAIFRQVALLGFCPSGVCSVPAAPTARHRRLALVTFLPVVALPPSRRGSHQARQPFPRIEWPDAFVRLQGLRPRGSRSASREHG
jgi:hypothetical protein